MPAGAIVETHIDAATLPRGFDRIVLAWVSDASGNVNGIASSPINGMLFKVEFVPDGGGTQPTNLYSVTLTDVAGVNVLAGQGASLSNATPTAIVPGVPLKDGTTTTTAPCALADALTLGVTGAGNAKGGKVVLYVR